MAASGQGDGADHNHKPAPEHVAPLTPLQLEALDYKPHVLNERNYDYGKPVDKSHCSVGPKLTDLTIDVAHVHEKDTPRRGDSYAERQAALHRDMPVSNEHYREIAKQGAELLSQGTFSLPLRNALDEAFQSDAKGHAGSKHVNDLLKYVNAQLCGTDTTLAREGNTIKVIETQYEHKKPTVGFYSLEKKDWIH